MHIPEFSADEYLSEVRPSEVHTCHLCRLVLFVLTSRGRTFLFQSHSVSHQKEPGLAASWRAHDLAAHLEAIPLDRGCGCGVDLKTCSAPMSQFVCMIKDDSSL